MAKTPAPIQPLITEVPLTAEAREQFLEQLFAGELPHMGELFIPGDSFYISASTHKRAKHMVKQLCEWLGIKPGYIGLEFESSGADIPDGRKYTIYIESSIVNDEFVLGGFLAYALTRYLIERCKQIHLFDTDQQAILLASASITFGLAAVILNGIDPSYNLLQRFRRPNPSLTNFPLPNYSQMTRVFLKQHRIHPSSFRPALTPWAERYLGLKKFRQPTHAVHDARHKIKAANSKILGLVWLFALLLGLGSFIYFQQVKPLPSELGKIQQKVIFFDQLTHICKDALVYDRQYADNSDIQTARALNAEALRCQSLENRLNAAQTQYQQLSEPQ